MRWALLVLLLAGCQVPDEPDITNGNGVVAVTWASGAGRVVVACPVQGKPVVQVSK